MSALALGTIGGFVSFASTSIGALLSQISRRKEGSTTWNLSIHFALGLMISASAFSLIGPAALGAKNSGHSVWSILAIALIGAAFVYLLKFQIQKLQTQSVQKTNHLILAAVLMLHNFPEGLASGSALAGLNLENALPILGGISIQNVPEGLLMVVCLQALGWSNSAALLGGIASARPEPIAPTLMRLLEEHRMLLIGRPQSQQQIAQPFGHSVQSAAQPLWVQETILQPRFAALAGKIRF